MRGVFTGATDSFDASRHAVDVGANPGARIRKTVRDNAALVKDEAVKPAPNPIEFRDIASDTSNEQATPGNIGQLSGNRLKFNPGAGDEGVYFVLVGGAETKVVTVQKNKPSQSVFLIPTLLPGDYQVEVRARISGGTELRTGRLEAVLTVT